MGTQAGFAKFAVIAISAMLLVSAHAQDAGIPAGSTGSKDRGKPAELQSVPIQGALGKAATEFTPWARITSLQVGWVEDQMLVFLDDPGVTNPDGCALVTNGYVTNPTHPAHDMFHTMLVSALISGRQVALVISGCYPTIQDRPQIISVAIK
jgi:hypothetical protein